MPRYERSYTGEKRTEFLDLQLTPTERRQIEDAAKEAGSTLSEWARDLLLARSATAAMLRAQRRNPEAKAIMDALNAAGGELNAIGNNLNGKRASPTTAGLQVSISRKRVDGSGKRFIGGALTVACWGWWRDADQGGAERWLGKEARRRLSRRRQKRRREVSGGDWLRRMAALIQ